MSAPKTTEPSSLLMAQIQKGFDRANKDWDRYRNDPVYHALVCSIVPTLDKGHVTGDDFRSAVEMAESIIASKRIVNGDYIE